jgi:hypothetical protein
MIIVHRITLWAIYTYLQAITVMLFADKNDADVSGLFLFFLIYFKQMLVVLSAGTAT